jgi:hypothetical protein
MRSLTLAVLIVVMLLGAAAVQASDKDIAVPGSHPAANLTSYTQYEDVLDRIKAYQGGLLQLKSAANLKSYTKYENVLDSIGAYQAELRKLRSVAEQEDIKDR